MCRLSPAAEQRGAQSVIDQSSLILSPSAWGSPVAPVPLLSLHLTSVTLRAEEDSSSVPANHLWQRGVVRCKGREENGGRLGSWTSCPLSLAVGVISGGVCGMLPIPRVVHDSGLWCSSLWLVADSVSVSVCGFFASSGRKNRAEM